MKLNRNDPLIIINAIHAYYDRKEERFKNDVVNRKRNKTNNNNNSKNEGRGNKKIKNNDKSEVINNINHDPRK